MGKLIDLTGKRFGRLIVIKKIGRVGHDTAWECKCDCGNLHNARSGDLKCGNVSSCGCLRKEVAKNKQYKHGLSDKKLYYVWKSMIRRCYNTKESHYSSYGGRGIKVCDAWKSDCKPFYEWALSSGYAEGLSIDRINVDGNYEPSNCQWISMLKQQFNKRNNHTLTYDGKTQTITEWALEIGVKQKTLLSRINDYGWSVERALTEKTKKELSISEKRE